MWLKHEARTDAGSGSCQRYEIAALAGVVPLFRYCGQCCVWGSRIAAGIVLYMATMHTHHNLTIRDFYIRLCRRGQPRKEAFMAAMRKLFLILNAMMRD